MFVSKPDDTSLVNVLNQKYTLTLKYLKLETCSTFTLPILMFLIRLLLPNLLAEKQCYVLTKTTLFQQAYLIQFCLVVCVSVSVVSFNILRLLPTFVRLQFLCCSELRTLSLGGFQHPGPSPSIIYFSTPSPFFSQRTFHLPESHSSCFRRTRTSGRFSLTTWHRP